MVQNEKIICEPTNKICFTKAEAIGALKKAKHGRQYNHIKRCYPCPYAINGIQHHHLTSKMHEKTLNIPILLVEEWMKLINFEEIKQ